MHILVKYIIILILIFCFQEYFQHIITITTAPEREIPITTAPNRDISIPTAYYKNTYNTSMSFLSTNTSIFRRHYFQEIQTLYSTTKQDPYNIYIQLRLF